MALHTRSLRRFAGAALASALFLALGSARVQAASPWPFDQRQVLLARSEGAEFPDDLAVAQLMDLFARNGRVRWIMGPGGKGEIVPIEIPKDFQWHSPGSVRQLGLRYKADGVVLLGRKGVLMEMHWYATLDGEPLFYESVALPEAGPRPGEPEARKKRLADWFNEIWARIPGQGYVTKRDLTTVAIEGAAVSGLKVGDRLQLLRLIKVERHPLLKTLVQVKSSPTGLGTVAVLGDPFTTVKIDYESLTDPIQTGDRWQRKTDKAMPVAASPAAPAAAAPAPQPEPEKDRAFVPIFAKKDEAPGTTPEVDEALKQQPEHKILDLTGVFVYDILACQETVGSTQYQMKSTSPGFEVQARGYLTPRWLLNAELGFEFVKWGGLDPAYNAASLTGDALAYRFGGAYRFPFLQDESNGGEITIGAGWRRWGATTSVAPSNVAPTSKAYAGLELNFGLQIPLMTRFVIFARGAKIFGASLTETPVTTGDSADNLFWEFEGGLRYRLTGVSLISGGLRLLNASSTFTGAGTRATQGDSASLAATVGYIGYTQKF